MGALRELPEIEEGVIEEVSVVVVIEGSGVVEEAVDGAGHSSRPQLRSVRQQPPPSDSGQDLKPLEQAGVSTTSASVVASTKVEDDDVEGGREDRVLEVGEAEILVLLRVDEVLGDKVVVTVGVTTTTEVRDGPGPPNRTVRKARTGAQELLTA